MLTIIVRFPNACAVATNVIVSYGSAFELSATMVQMEMYNNYYTVPVYMYIYIVLHYCRLINHLVEIVIAQLETYLLTLVRLRHLNFVEHPTFVF